MQKKRKCFSRVTIVCPNGRFGDHCQYPCGHCKKTAPACQVQTGACLSGCDDGWKGQNCDMIVGGLEGS